MKHLVANALFIVAHILTELIKSTIRLLIKIFCSQTFVQMMSRRLLSISKPSYFMLIYFLFVNIFVGQVLFNTNGLNMAIPIIYSTIKNHVFFHCKVLGEGASCLYHISKISCACFHFQLLLVFQFVFLSKITKL